MSKSKSQYVCSECGAASPKWLGKCPGCGAWNSLTETAAQSAQGKRFEPLVGQRAGASQVQQLGAVQTVEVERIETGIDEFDRVLGGGLVPGGVVLLGGDPGIGKSTLLLQSLADMSARVPALYVTGEESLDQVALRSRRLGVSADKLLALAEISIDRILEAFAEHRPQVAVVDSIQTLYSEALSSAPGSVSQVRECAAMLTRAAKQTGCTVIMVGHVTKEGTLAGPRVLEHIVDTVLYFEGDTHSSFRLIRAFKNRFGPVNELGVFAMGDRGLKGVSNPSALFLSHSHTGDDKPVPGTCVLITQEGTRPLLVEVQALLDTAGGSPRRLAVGLDQARLALLLAVLHRHAGIASGDQDVFVNAVGGVRITEPAADLAVVLAAVSSLKNRALPKGLAVFGELGLAGEIRPAPRGLERIREAAKLGFSHIMLPRANLPKGASAKQVPEGLTLLPVGRIEEAMDALRGLQ
ncbi:MAG TPA: DNA repair protein RadA [Burkholderiaceae bacterium]|nr:DNA repair protein RadA [Burkholderiaceae bacterium]